MNIRYAAYSGSFYESSANSCRHHAEKLIDEAELPDDLPGNLRGGLVPHAGWQYSGKLAAMTFKALLPEISGKGIETFVLLGADHQGTVSCGSVYDSGVWQSPLGEVPIDSDIAAAILAGGECLKADCAVHEREHSIEVQLPFLQVLCPGAKIVPIAVPATPAAVGIGKIIGKVLADGFPDAVVVASTDLTHHGGHFPAPGGRGLEGVQWAVENDRRMLKLVGAMEADEVISEARSHSNACGAGAIAAAISACAAMGASAGKCLVHTNSYEVMHRMYPGYTDYTTVGYASVVFGD